MSPFKNKSITDLFKIDYPIVQGGMVWVSGGKLAAAVSNAGCLGLIGAGSMKPDLLKLHLEKAKGLTSKPFGVNVPLLYEKAEEQIQTALDAGVRIFFTSAGSPKKFTSFLKDKGCIVVHVTSSPELSLKCEAAGVDAIVAEGFEAGGHNGRDEITTMSLIPQVRDLIKIPLIAAGGIGDGRGIAAALALGADGVQLGTRFAATQESSAHDNFKEAIIKARSSDTLLTMKDLVPVRLLKNKFFQEILSAEENCATKEELQSILGKGRAKKGMLEGDMDVGELEIGQISALIKNTPTVSECVLELLDSYKRTLKIF
ncbi:MAG: enoyl-[acyl-carrier protein] reductase II [Bacteriovoracaceae bacterium]|jgi:enoyl-[acyl-carrier protein] reductase II